MQNSIKLILILFSLILFSSKSNAIISVNAKTAILQDYLSGEILYEKDADLSIYPASMTKIMTSIIAFDLIKKGELTLDEKFIVSENAWRLSTAGYSSMFIMVGDEVSVENLLRGIIVASGNDACIALAEGIAGTEEEFAVLMTEKALEIGMENTNFSNSSGINDPNNYSTVRDILIMSNYLIKNYPEYYHYYKEKEFTWDRTGGDPITQGNRNPLLYKNMGADGIKTGFLTVEKYSLAASIKVGDRRITVRRVFYKTPHAMWRFFGYYGGLNVVGNLHNYGQFSDDSTFQLIPAWHNKMQAVSYEDHLYTRTSHYSFEVINNKLRLFPTPSSLSPTNLWIGFTIPKDAWLESSTSKIGIGGVNNMSNIPFQLLFLSLQQTFKHNQCYTLRSVLKF